jgi:predicted amidophosphoribosyltransferase
VLHRGLAELLALIVPPACAVCHDPLSHSEDVLCAGCRRGLPWLLGPRCARCGLPAPCRPCPGRAAAFDAAWAPVAYAGSARSVVTALKFRGGLALAGLMAAQIAAGAPSGLLADATLVPVPLHPHRRRRRGFDQAQRLAAALGVRTRLPVATCLRRRGPAHRQLGAGRADRMAADRMVIGAVGRAPAVAVLVDDVHTTGATFDACARALRAAGSRRVACVAYARTLPGGRPIPPTPWATTCGTAPNYG